jgi:hypothetical protein
MTVEQRLYELEHRVTVLERETYTDIERRLVRNTDTLTAKLREEAEIRSANHVVTNLRNDIANAEKREQQSLAWQAEVKEKLTEHLATPCPTHGVDRDIWLRTREELEITLDEILRGPGGRAGDGHLRQMAQRDGAPATPCLIETQRTLAGLRAELAAAEAAA